MIENSFNFTAMDRLGGSPSDTANSSGRKLSDKGNWKVETVPTVTFRHLKSSNFRFYTLEKLFLSQNLKTKY